MADCCDDECRQAYEKCTGTRRAAQLIPGISLGWRSDTDEVAVGVFISKAFTFDLDEEKIRRRR